MARLIIFFFTPILSLLWLNVGLQNQCNSCMENVFPKLSTFLIGQAFLQLMWFYSHQEKIRLTKDGWGLLAIIGNVTFLLTLLIWVAAGTYVIYKSNTCHDESEGFYNWSLAAVIISYFLDFIFVTFLFNDMYFEKIEEDDDYEEYILN